MDSSVLRPKAREGIIAAAWLVLWIAAIAWTVAGWRTEPNLTLAYWLGAVSIVLLVVGGYLLARASRWLHLLALVPYVTALVVTVYGFAMFLPTESGPVNTSAAGAGAAMLMLATAISAAVLAALGAATARLMHVLRGRD